MYDSPEDVLVVSEEFRAVLLQEFGRPRRPQQRHQGVVAEVRGELLVTNRSLEERVCDVGIPLQEFSHPLAICPADGGMRSRNCRERSYRGRVYRIETVVHFHISPM